MYPILLHFFGYKFSAGTFKRLNSWVCDINFTMQENFNDIRNAGKYYYLSMRVSCMEVLNKLEGLINANEVQYKHTLRCWKMVEKNESCNGCERIIEEEKNENA